MSKIYSKYLEIKSKNLNQKNILYLFKSGIFFIFIADDAVKASSLLGLKLSKLNDSVLKCAFPIASFEKYEQILKDLGYELKVVDILQDKLLSSNNYLNNSKIKLLIDKVINTDVEALSISDAYELLCQIKTTFSSVVESCEENGK